MHLVVIVLIYNLPFFRSDVSIWGGTLWHVLALALMFLSLLVRDAAVHIWPALRDRYKRLALIMPAAASVTVVQICLLLGIGAAEMRIGDDPDAQWTWRGWEHVPASQALGGSLRVAREVGATARYALEGTGVEIYGSVGRGKGRIEVLIDQRSYGEYDLYYSVRLFAVRDLTPDKHELIVIAKSNGETTIDYLKIPL